LLVVLVMLTLFAIVGLTFVFYADSEAQSQRTAREAVNIKPPDVDPETAFAMFLGQMIYDQADDNGVFTCMRGHSLLRNMFGYNDGGTNATPYNGTGRLSEQITFSWVANNVVQSKTVDGYDLINYMCWLDPNGNFIDNNTDLMNNPAPTRIADASGHVGGIRDPERLGVRDNTGRGAQNNINYSSFKTDPRGSWTGGFNAGYTYPDQNNMFLAAVKADGTVLVPSFFRPWGGFAQGATGAVLDPTQNANWYASTMGKYMILRPRPVDNLTQGQVGAWNAAVPVAQQLPAWPFVLENLTAAQLTNLQNLISTLQNQTAVGLTPAQYQLFLASLPPNQNQLFPYPEDTGTPGGDVKNLVGTAGGNDAIWMDLGAPVMIMPDGRKYKMMFAPLIMDLDGKLNVNAHGNIRGANSASLSNQGFGPWEVNLEWLTKTTGTGTTTEWANLFTGRVASGTTVTKWGKYGPNQLPTNGTSSAAGGSGIPYFYAPVDYDAANEGQGGTATAQISLPGVTGTGNAAQSGYTCFPLYPAGYGSNTAAEALNHPLLYDAYRNALYNANNDDYVFQASNLAALLRYGDTGSEFLSSDLLSLCRTNFSLPRVRRLVTTHSFDVNLPGIGPWVYNYRDTTYPAYQLSYTTPPASVLQGATRAFPDLSLRPNNPPNGSSFATDWRQVALKITAGSVNPATFSFDGTTRFDLSQAVVNLGQAANQYPTPDTNGVIDLTQPAIQTQFTAAQTARTNLAAQLYYRLILATGAFDPFQYKAATDTAPSMAELRGLRSLAQLAVNMVDYLDRDDYSTPFNWGSYGSNDFIALTMDPVPPPATNVPDSTPGTSKTPITQQWVFGTELPRLLLNEVYIEFKSDPNDPGILNIATPMATYYNVNVWAELYNPFNADANLVDPITSQQSVARLQNYDQTKKVPTTAVYQLLITKQNPNGLRDPWNILGSPEVTNTATGQTTLLKTHNSWATAPNYTEPLVVLPANGKYSAPTNQGSNDTFYLLGPAVPGTGTNPPTPIPFPTDPTINLAGANKALIPPAATMSSTNMSYRHNIPADGATPTNPTLILQRLACPYIPLQPNPALANYNPYVTVDYMENIPVNHAADVSGAGGPDSTPIAQRRSWGKFQPYSSYGPYPPATTAFAGLQWPQLKANATTNPVVAANGQLPNMPQHTFFQHNAFDGKGGTPATPALNSCISGDWPPTAPAGYPSGANSGFSWLTHLDRPLVSPMELLQVSAFKPHELTQQFVTATQSFAHRAPWFDPYLHFYRFFESVQTAPLATNASTTGRVAGLVNLNTIFDEEILQALCDSQTSSFFSQADVKAIFNNLIASRTPGMATAGGTLGGNDRPFRSLATGLLFTTTFKNAVATGAAQVATPTAMSGVAGGIPWSIQKGSVLLIDTGAAQETVTVTAVDTVNGTFTATFAQAHAANAVIAPVGGIENTILRSTGGATSTSARLFQNNSIPAHPYAQYQVLNKIYNNATVRSNVFAIWLTVGFFEVTDDTTRPVKLGAEIGRTENRHVRHRMFAIVDRSWYTSCPGPQNRFNPHSPSNSGLANTVNPQPILYFSIID
jgi:hypothetical protein